MSQTRKVICDPQKQTLSSGRKVSSRSDVFRHCLPRPVRDHNLLLNDSSLVEQLALWMVLISVVHCQWGVTEFEELALPRCSTMFLLDKTRSARISSMLLIRRQASLFSQVFRLQRDGASAGNLKPNVEGQQGHATHPTESDSEDGCASSHVGSSLCDFVARSPRRDVGGRSSRVSETAITSQSPRYSGNPPGCLQQHIRRETLPNDG